MKSYGIILIAGILFLSGCVNININNPPINQSSAINQDSGINQNSVTESVCGNNSCEAGENSETCPKDCKISDISETCGNGICELFESPETCVEDCTSHESVCGNEICESDETEEECPGDCPQRDPVCGNRTCETGETAENCPQDCTMFDWEGKICGNNVCEPGEDSETCPQDCSTIDELGNVCGNEICEAGESSESCAEDCVIETASSNQFPTVTASANPSNPSQSLTFDLTITAEDDLGIDTITWESEQFIPFHEHSVSFDCGSQLTCANTWEDLITVEEGLIEIAVFATDTSGQESEWAVLIIDVQPFVPFEIELGPVCGNDVCQETETNDSCPQDCIVTETHSTQCGNNTCETGETETSCPADCETAPSSVCGNGICETGETETNCSADCASTPEPEEDECTWDSECGYKEVCNGGKCVDVECTSNPQCGECERCDTSSNVCRSCGYGPLGCYC